MHKQEMFITDVPFIVDVRMGRIKKLRLGYFMETEATWFSPAACNKTIFVTYLYVASCRRKEKQGSTGRAGGPGVTEGCQLRSCQSHHSPAYGESLIKRSVLKGHLKEDWVGLALPYLKPQTSCHLNIAGKRWVDNSATAPWKWGFGSFMPCCSHFAVENTANISYRHK